MRDLVAAAKAAKAKKAANGHARDLEAESRIKALNAACELWAEVKSRHPSETRDQQLLRFHRAVSNTTDVDLFEMFYGLGDGEFVEVPVEA